jgi:putative peptidoglycan lipid II flippase
MWAGPLTAAWSAYSFTRGVYGLGQVRRATVWDVVSAVSGVVALGAVLLMGLRGIALLAPLVLSYGAYVLASWPRTGQRASAPLAPALRRELVEFVLLGITGTVASGVPSDLRALSTRDGDAVRAGKQTSHDHARVLSSEQDEAVTSTIVTFLLSAAG